MTLQSPAKIVLTGLFPAQCAVARSPARFKVVCAGRRAGKSRLGAYLCFARALTGGRVWWVAPNYPMSEAAWRVLRSLSRNLPNAEISESHRMLKIGAGWIQVKSADRPDSLRGEGLDLVVLDEAAYIPEAAWSEALRPALSDRLGGALFISTPAGRNWFWRLWQEAHLNPGPEYQAWQFPTSANPFIKPEEIEAARLRMPERIFEQEFLGWAVQDGAGVFRKVREAATATPQDGPVAGHEYLFGVDWGRSVDFTVITVLDTKTRECVALDRFNQVDYALQTGRLKALYAKWKPFCIVAESNSMGEVVIEQLLRDGLPLMPFYTSNASKTVAIEALAVALERGEFKIVPDETLIAELEAFESERLESGLTRYSAPSGQHDDSCMSLAIGYSGLAPAAAAESGPGISF